MKRVFILLFLLSLFPLNLYAAEISYEGSSTIGKFITDASKVYKNSTFKINVKTESRGGTECAIKDTCDMGGVARRVGNVAIKRNNVVATLIGRDAIAVIVNAENPVTALTSNQIKDIFTDKIKNWSEVGGPDLPIKTLIVKKSSATNKIFQKIINKGEKYSGCTVITPDEKVPAIVAEDKSAIGQISFAFIQGNKDVTAISVDRQEASVNNSTYPVTRPLYIATQGEPKGEVKAFLDWTLSPAGQKIIKQRFIGVK